MDNLESLSDDELEEELDRRRRRASYPPSVIREPVFSDLIRTVVEGVNRSISDGYEDEDFKQYVYEEAMKAIYGKDYFKWRNKQPWAQ